MCTIDLKNITLFKYFGKMGKKVIIKVIKMSYKNYRRRILLLKYFLQE